MREIKQLFSLLIAVTLVTGNIYITNASAAETEASADAEVVQEISDIESETADIEIISDDTTITEKTEETESVEVVENIEVSVDETADISENENVIPADNNEDASAITIGNGELEGLINKKVFQVALPIQENLTDYVADPQNLIAETDAAKHPDAVYDENSNVYFYNGDIVSEDGSTKKKYSGSSSPLTIINKSSCAVTVVARVNAFYEQGAVNPVELAAGKDWKNNERPSIYLSVINSADSSETVLTKSEQVITASIEGCPGAYKCVYENTEVGENGYAYRIMDENELTEFKSTPEGMAVDTDFKEFSLTMTGECNTQDVWDSNTEYDFPSTSIIWNVGFAASAKPSISITEYTVAYGSAIEIPYSLGLYGDSATTIIGADLTTAEGENISILNNSEYFSKTNETISLSSDLAYYVRSKNGAVLKITFDDPENTSFDITLDNNASPSIGESSYTINNETVKFIINYDLGIGSKAATEIASIKYQNNDLTSSAYSTIGDGKIVFSKTAIRELKQKNGGNIYISFNDDAHTKCIAKVVIE